MKATGIVRRIDDLGRVVIPKEIRRTLRLREGTPLEIFTDREGEIILKKYSPMMELTTFAVQYAEAMAQSTGLLVCITDRDQVIAVAGGAKKDLLQRNISRQLEQAINERNTVMAGREDKAFIQLVDEELEGVSAHHLRGRCNRRRGADEQGAKGQVWRYGNKAGIDGSRVSGTPDGRLKAYIIMIGRGIPGTGTYVSDLYRDFSAWFFGAFFLVTFMLYWHYRYLECNLRAKGYGSV